MSLNFLEMKSTNLLLTVIFLFSASTCISSQSVIIGKHFDPDTEIKFYPPFENFSNNVVSEKVQVESSGRFIIPVKHNTPTMAQILIGGQSLSVFLNLYDTIYVDIYTSDFKTDIYGISIKGTNADGIKHFNLLYDNPSYKKFRPLNIVFSKNKDLPTDSLIILLEKELINQTLWLDSLRNKNKIDENFFRYIKTETLATLIWGVFKSSREHYEGITADSATKAKSVKIKNSILTYFSFEDSVLRRCLTAPGFLHTYYKTIYKADSVSIDTSQVIIYDEFFYLHQAPFEVRKYAIGYYLLRFREVVPTMFDYCSLFRKFIAVYGTGEIIDSMRVADSCNNLDKDDFEIISVYETDFNDMIHNHFQGKRLYIDLWATWCIPCKMEFKNYDEDLYSFLNSYNIKNVFISIDKDKRHQIWNKEISLLGLTGYHIRANPSLYESIKQLVFNGDKVSIPRYIIVNEEGTIVSFNASRPSSIRSEIVRLFDK